MIWKIALFLTLCMPSSLSAFPQYFRVEEGGDDALTWPICTKDTPTCVMKERRRVRDWYRRQFLEPYDKVGLRDPSWDALAKEFISASIDIFSWADSSVDYDDLKPTMEKLIELKCPDPVVCYCLARAEKRLPLKKMHINRMCPGFGRADYPKGGQFTTALITGDEVNSADPRLGETRSL